LALSLNRAQILGNCGRAADIRQTTSGTKVANFSVATTNRWKDKTGAVQEETTWHNVTAWAQLADICGQIIQAGTRVYVDGPMVSETYQAKDGVKKTRVFIKADQVIAMSSGRDREQSGGQAKVSAPVTTRDQGPAWDESEMPF
jgi:single-strand DNA-binding protein